MIWSYSFSPALFLFCCLVFICSSHSVSFIFLIHTFLSLPLYFYVILHPSSLTISFLIFHNLLNQSHSSFQHKFKSYAFWEAFPAYLLWTPKAFTVCSISWVINHTLPSDISCVAVVLSCYLSLITLFNFPLIYVLSLQVDHKLAKGRNLVLWLFVSPTAFSPVSYTQ